MTLPEILHGLVDKVHGWGTQPEMHAAIDEHFGISPPAEEAPAEDPAKA